MEPVFLPKNTDGFQHAGQGGEDGREGRKRRFVRQGGFVQRSGPIQRQGGAAYQFPPLRLQLFLPRFVFLQRIDAVLISAPDPFLLLGKL